jgi:hypothetical protein
MTDVFPSLQNNQTMCFTRTHIIIEVVGICSTQKSPPFFLFTYSPTSTESRPGLEIHKLQSKIH